MLGRGKWIRESRSSHVSIVLSKQYAIKARQQGSKKIHLTPEDSSVIIERATRVHSPLPVQFDQDDGQTARSPALP